MNKDYRDHERDFTEAHYAELLNVARDSYTFVTFPEAQAPGRTILWRHDVDFSPHRARRLAQLEAALGVRATYFVLLHSEFYNALEPEIVRIFREIAGLGHCVGLHFDAQFYDGGESLETLLGMERDLLQTTLAVPIDAFSWHNPFRGNWIESESGDSLAGMSNAYSRAVRERFSYVSDSHGIWRFRRLYDVLSRGDEEHLQVLTHPEWWVPEAMSPRARISRAVSGRAARNEKFYDETLAAIDRPNVR